MAVDGTYACTTQTPLGELPSTFTVKVAGDRFTGVNQGTLGAMEVIDGRIDGDRLTWTMEMTAPMPMTLTCAATIDGDRLVGAVNAAGFGPMPMSGTRVG